MTLDISLKKTKCKLIFFKHTQINPPTPLRPAGFGGLFYIHTYNRYYRTRVDSPKTLCIEFCYQRYIFCFLKDKAHQNAFKQPLREFYLFKLTLPAGSNRLKNTGIAIRLNLRHLWRVFYFYPIKYIPKASGRDLERFRGICERSVLYSIK